ncbi:MAG: AraC family transcriptional regulator [Azoarcus sp.]|jgi:AraC-like DNA-binding protein|nr:AraC family transcriptional regulator [Azoarcus sp.]
MAINESGVLPQSVRLIFTPSSLAERALLYTTRIGHYFCDRAYRFNHHHEVALQKSHRMNYMLMLIQRGALDLNCDGRHYVVESRRAMLFDCRKPHEYFALTDSLEFHWLTFNGPPAEIMYREALSIHDGRHVFQPADPARIQLDIMKIISASDGGRRMSEHACAEVIYSILCQLTTPGAGGDSKAGALIERACRYMDEHCGTSLSVSDAASHVGLSSSCFTRHFKAETGHSPHEYLTLRRIDAAKALLLGSALSVQQIAYDTGYGSEENFNRAFRKKVGLPPGAFRKTPV